MAPLQETPATGCLHPLHKGFFDSPSSYMRWYAQHGPRRGTDSPVVAVLLYRKHVITKQPYIGQLLSSLEQQVLMSTDKRGCNVMTFLCTETFVAPSLAHTSTGYLAAADFHKRRGGAHHRQGRVDHRPRAAAGQTRSAMTVFMTNPRQPTAGSRHNPTLQRTAVPVNAIVNTIGFPLVGGPAGTMEGGRQADIARSILQTKNVPYVVAAPLLIQDMASWVRDGVAGLQSVVLYSLPELDGAIDTVPIGGLVGDDIYLVPERVERLAQRLLRWTALRKKPPSVRCSTLMIVVVAWTIVVLCDHAPSRYHAMRH